MPSVSTPMQSAILAVLRAVKDAGLGQISRTALFKLVYLLDCLHAEAHDGQISSGASWYFHHYGPYAVNLAEGVDELATRGLIQSRAGESRDRDFSLYWLGEYPLGPSLPELGLQAAAAARFDTFVRKFSGDLSKLLDYSYFQTLPMQNAVPGRSIDFSVLKGLDQFKSHQHSCIKDQGKILRAATLIDNLTHKFVSDTGNARSLSAHRPIYDKAYAKAMKEFDREDSESEAISFNAKLT